MAKSTSHPDCVHCRFMISHKHGEYRCKQHGMILHSPVSLFCKTISPVEHKDSAYEAWFQETVNVESLDANTLYTRVETPIEGDAGDNPVQIDIEVVAPLTDYVSWSAGMFWQKIRELRAAKRAQYNQNGYRADDTSK